jgi:hypothetical protein
MGRTLAIAAAALLLFAGAVWFAAQRPPPPLGYAGLTFTRLTQAASGRTPNLDRGALVQAVDADSPAAKAGIEAGAIVAAIDGVALRSAAQGAEKIQSYRVGETVTLTVHDGLGEKAREVALTFAAMPDPKLTQKYSVHPPRTLAKEARKLPPMAANAAWSNRLTRGANIDPMKLVGFGNRQCNGVAPEKWRIVAYEPDGSLFHVAMPGRFQQALIANVPMAGTVVQTIRAMLLARFGSEAKLAPSQEQPHGFRLAHFGNARGGTGFVVYREVGANVQMWIAAAAATEAEWSLPIAGAVVFGLNCWEAGAPHEKTMAATSVSVQCLEGNCQDSDLAASYLATLKLGYVNDGKGRTYLINPKRDYWISGAQGPGFYHQVGGENEKLLPGRTNVAR